MAAIGPTFNQPAQDARVIWKDDSLEYIPHKPGCLLDRIRLASPAGFERWEFGGR